MSRRTTGIQRVGHELLTHFIDPSQLELRHFARSGWRMKIQPNDRLEIWHGLRLLGQLTGDAVHSIITHHLAGAALGASLLHQMATLREPRKIDPDAGGEIPLPVEPRILPPPTKGQARYARKKAAAPIRPQCGATTAATGRPCTIGIPCPHHPPQDEPSTVQRRAPRGG